MRKKEPCRAKDKPMSSECFALRRRKVHHRKLRIYSAALIFCFFLIKQKEEKEKHMHFQKNKK
jgi:hypothetical protein